MAKTKEKRIYNKNEDTKKKANKKPSFLKKVFIKGYTILFPNLAQTTRMKKIGQRHSGRFWFADMFSDDDYINGVLRLCLYNLEKEGYLSIPGEKDCFISIRDGIIFVPGDHHIFIERHGNGFSVIDIDKWPKDTFPIINLYFDYEKGKIMLTRDYPKSSEGMGWDIKFEKNGKLSLKDNGVRYGRNIPEKPEKSEE